jgi:flagellar basal-body rod modification protein FlgD
MDIASIGTSTNFATASTDTARSALSSDFTTFLKMMTAQMRNQDPLNPLDSTDFATQLATFSGVEQQVRSNELLGNLGAQLNMMGMSQLAGWVGMEARAAVPVPFSGTPVTLYPTPDARAERAELVVTDHLGTEVQRLPVPVSSEPVVWAGTDANGNPLPADTYHFTLDTFAYGELMATQPVESYARITEARSGTGTILLLLENGQRVSADAVTGLRNPA